VTISASYTTPRDSIASGEKRLFKWQNQVILTSSGRPLEKCRLMITEKANTMGFTNKILGACLIVFLASKGMAGGLPNSDEETLLENWLTELYSGDTARLEAVLADHFQLSLGSGHGFKKDEALKVAPVVNSPAEVSNLIITRSETIIVARYDVEVKQMIEGELQSRMAPRLTVFELREDGWYVTAHASFAVPVAPKTE